VLFAVRAADPLQGLRVANSEPVRHSKRKPEGQVMAYEFPDSETLGKWNALLMAVLIEARALAWSQESHSRIAELMDAVHTIPDLLCRWPDLKEELVLRDLISYEHKYRNGRMVDDTRSTLPMRVNKTLGFVLPRPGTTFKVITEAGRKLSDSVWVRGRFRVRRAT
jgi:hypothetical protein